MGALNGYYEPRHIEYWVASDGMSFPTKEEAEQWEKIIANPDYHKPYTCEKKDWKEFYSVLE